MAEMKHNGNLLSGHLRAAVRSKSLVSPAYCVSDVIPLWGFLNTLTNRRPEYFLTSNGNLGTAWPVRDTDRYAFGRDALDFIFIVIVIFIFRWKVQDFSPWNLHTQVSPTLVHIHVVDGLCVILEETLNYGVCVSLIPHSSASLWSCNVFYSLQALFFLISQHPRQTALS